MNKWDSKRIAFISILIAMSISFVIIGARFAALSSFPNIKLSFAGLPIKIIGYIFGPIIGFIIGFTTDVISFVFMPTFYHPVYSVALGVSGMLPGLFAVFFNYFYKVFSKKNILKKLNAKRVFLIYLIKLETSKNNFDKSNALEKKYNKLLKKIDKISVCEKEKYQLNFGLVSSILIISVLLILLMFIFIFTPQDIINSAFEDKGILRLLSNKIIFIIIVALGLLTCVVSLFIFRYKMNQKNFLEYVPIVTFVVLTEFINIPIIAYGDYKTVKIDFITSMIASLSVSAIKIWFNLVIISFAIKIVMPLITKKTFNGYV